MPLVLTLHKAREPSNRQRESRTLEEGSLSIGRGPGNDWVLQDPAQYLSKTHCVVSCTAGGFVLTDCSSNGVFLNGSRDRIERDSAIAIGDGDEFTLGDYLVRVSEVDSISSRTIIASAASAPRGTAPSIDRDDPFGLNEFLAPPPVPPVPPPAPPAPPPPRFDPFADPRLSARDDPFGDAHDVPDILPGRRPFGDPAPPVAPAAPDPFDVRDRKAPDPFGTEDDLFSGAKPAVSWQGPSQPDNVDAVAQAFTPPKVVVAPDVDDWDRLLGDEPPPGTPNVAVPPPAPPPPTPAPQPAGMFARAPEPPQAAAVEPSGAAASLLAAFLDGAGVPTLDLSTQEPEAYFRQLGELFATMVESLRDVLMSRAAVKGEFGVDQTMLRPRENNALKFSVTPSDAVAALLQPGRPGYLPPLRAAKEAFDDVRMHQLAVMAGVQAALFNLLKTFDPAALEARLEKGSVIESILPSTRRAKLWEAFCGRYKDIARDADSDFRAVFGDEFARAYTKQAQSR